jgi:hypothetical protein
VFAIGGWADGYTRTVFRLLEHLDVPAIGLVGPWSHTHPNTGMPGPAVGYLREALRFWDRWLKGRSNDVMDGPALRAWIQDSAPPHENPDHRPGRWVGEPSWPTSGVIPTELDLAPGRIVGLAARGQPSDGAVVDADASVEAARDDGGPSLRLRSPIGVGHGGGRWFPYAGEPDLPGRQHDADGASLLFDSEPLSERLEILGEPVVELDVESDRPVATLVVRLLDVDPAGVATRVTYGALNLTHRDSHAQPTPLTPGERVRVRMGLQHVGQAFPPGHRVRIAVSTDYWPQIWPAPEPVTIRLRPAASRLILPVRPPRAAEDREVRVAPHADGAPPLEVETLTPPENARRVVRDVAGEAVTHEVVRDTGQQRIVETDLTQQHRTVERFTNDGDDPTAVRAEIEHLSTLSRGDWETRVRLHTQLEVDASDWIVHAELEAHEGNERVASRTWSSRIPRDLV